jgi:arsenite-transporting ATPase
VLAAERLPVLESIELYQQLGKSGVNIGGLVVNKRSPKGQGEFLEARRSQEDRHLDTLDAELAQVPCQELVLAGQDVVGLAALEQFAESLSEA